MLGQIRCHPDRHKLAGLSFDGIFERALDIVLRDTDLRDAAVIQVFLKLAIGDLFDAGRLHPDTMQDDDPPQGNEKIPDVELCLFIHDRFIIACQNRLPSQRRISRYSPALSVRTRQSPCTFI